MTARDEHAQIREALTEAVTGLIGYSSSETHGKLHAGLAALARAGQRTQQLEAENERLRWLLDTRPGYGLTVDVWQGWSRAVERAERDLAAARPGEAAQPGQAGTP